MGKLAFYVLELALVAGIPLFIAAAFLASRTRPAWLRPEYLCLHLGAGALITLVLVLLYTPAPAVFVAVLATAIAKEYGEQPSDFIGADQGQPWNGILDVLAFLPAPAWWWWHGG